MAKNVKNYQCPSCTGPLHFVGKSGKLECDYCGASYTIEEIEALYEPESEAESTASDKNEQGEHGKNGQEKSGKKAQNASGNTQNAAGGRPKGRQENAWDLSELSSDWGEAANGMKVYSCPSCGAELICEETTAATACPYCGNPTVISENFAGTLKPDYVIPFKINQAEAEAALKEFYKGKRLLPRVFSAQNTIQEVKGIYVPFWLFNGSATGDISVDAEKSSTRREGDYRVTEVSHYNVTRSGSLEFDKVPVDASSKMPDDHMDSLEPFDYGELKPFSTAYLPGYFADKYDVTAKESQKRADRRVEQSVTGMLLDSVTGYTSTKLVSKNVKIKRGKVNYGLLPVYMLTTKWNDESYLFAINGQTGKIVGNLPIDKLKLRLWRLGIFGGVTGVLGTLIYYLLI